MAHALDVPHSSIGQEDAKFDFEIAFFGESIVEALLKFPLILRMDAAKCFAVSGWVMVRIEAEDSVVLIRPVDIFLTGDVPGPASGVAEALPFSQVGFAAAEGFIRFLSFLAGANGGNSEGEIVGQLYIMFEGCFIEFAGFG